MKKYESWEEMMTRIKNTKADRDAWVAMQKRLRDVKLDGPWKEMSNELKKSRYKRWGN